MLDFLFRKFLPFGLARTLSLAGIPLLQFLIAGFCSREEAGRFYLLSSLAFIASQIADLGISRAMPVIYAESDDKAHSLIAEITMLRWAAGVAAGLLFLLINGYGDVIWQWQQSGIVMLLFCFGRVILLGNQGYCHARQQYGLLLRGSFVHMICAGSFLLIAAAMGKFGAESALAALTVGVWAELVALDNRAAHPVKTTGCRWSEAVKVVAPYASVGFFTAISNRVESVIAGKFLDQGALGLFGTLDSAFKLAIWPSYVSAQTLYPSVRDAVAREDGPGLRRLAARHYAASSIICMIAMIISLGYWYSGFSQNSELTVAAAFLWVSLWISVPFAWMIPLYYSRKLEEAFARITFYTTLLRCVVAVLLVIRFGYVGLCAAHAIISLISLLVFQYCLRRETAAQAS